MMILNAPKVIYRFFAIISKFLDEETKKKIQIFKGRETWEAPLHALIAPDQV